MHKICTNVYFIITKNTNKKRAGKGSLNSNLLYYIKFEKTLNIFTMLDAVVIEYIIAVTALYTK